MADLRALMPSLEGSLPESGLQIDEARSLVEFVLGAAWSDYWVALAIGWVDSGVWSDAIAASLNLISQDKKYSQNTRHRAWQYVKHRR